MTEERKKALFAEIGKYCTDISKLVFGGIILAGLMDLEINRLALILSGLAAGIVIGIISGILIRRLTPVIRKGMEE